MQQSSMLRSLIVLSLSLLALALPAWAQKPSKESNKPATGSITDAKANAEKNNTPAAGKISVTISEVVKDDAQAKSVAAGRLIPVRFVWLCGSESNAKLTTLDARLITLNTDGKQTTVTKRLADWTINKPITSVIELPIANDVFAKNFTLELVGKFTTGKVEQTVSTSKQGSFPVPNNKEGKGVGQVITPQEVGQAKGVKEVAPPAGNTVRPNFNPKPSTGNSIGNSKAENNSALGNNGAFKAVTLEILELLKEDAKAKPSTNLHERLVPGVIKWKGESVNQGKLVALEAVLETVNTDGTTSRVSKKILDLAVDKLIAETILLPVKEGIFARDFKLTLSGKCASGEGANRQEVAISANKLGSFPLPNITERKK